jgi:2-methylcitrate dehydratase
MFSKGILRRYFSNITLKKDSNQAYEIGKYAIDFLKNGKPSQKVIDRVKLFHTDSVVCGLSALALKTNAPSVLKNEALQYGKKSSSTNPRPKLGYAKVFGSNELVVAEKAIAANASAVREWDSNGTVFGYNKNIPGHQAGEFGHNDFYPVVIAAAQQNASINGLQAAKAMILLDEIRGRLAEVFSLKTYKIDHVVHGAIASAATYGALMGATPEQIEHAIGMFCAHYIPFRAIRAGKQLSDSKGASAAISTEAAILCMKRAMNGFIGPKDIFRNPEAIWRLNEPTNGDSPFNLVLSMEGDDFAIMGMHFKLGLYEHQSAGAIEGTMKLLTENKFLEAKNPDSIDNIKIVAYQPAFGIIGDPAKKNPTTRQSADHSMVYIISTLLSKALNIPDFNSRKFNNFDEVWKLLMLEPKDYGGDAIKDPITRALMNKITFEHGGKEYDEKYPDGIPTSVVIKTKGGKTVDSGLIMYPSGHARNTTADLKGILDHKFNLIGSLALSKDNLTKGLQQLQSLDKLSNSDLQSIYNHDIKYADKSIDD